jgi:ABC-type uncharacterized transport system involved in gliding motility auxiliary subunit
LWNENDGKVGIVMTQIEQKFMTHNSFPIFAWRHVLANPLHRKVITTDLPSLKFLVLKNKGFYENVPMKKIIKIFF